MIATQPMTTDLPARFAALGIAVVEYAVTGADLARMDSAFGASVTASPAPGSPARPAYRICAAHNVTGVALARISSFDR